MKRIVIALLGSIALSCGDITATTPHKVTTDYSADASVSPRDARSDSHPSRPLPRADAGYHRDASHQDAGHPLDTRDGRIERIISPPTSDSDCIALFHFDLPHPLQNECGSEYQLLDSGSRVGGGRFNDGRYFDGRSYLSGLGNITNSLENQLTIEAWIKPDRSRGSFEDGDRGYIFHSVYHDPSYPSTSERGYGCALYVTERGLGFELGINNHLVDINTDFYLVGGEYVHLAGTFDGNSVRLYFQGTLRVARDTQGIITRIPYQNAAFSIGADSDGKNRFVGTIDELRVSKRAREFRD